MSLARILVISFSPLDRDPRVRRQVRLLARQHEVTAAGFGRWDLPGAAAWPLEGSGRGWPGKVLAALQLAFRRFRGYYEGSPAVRSLLRRWEEEGRPAFDLVVANDVDALPVGLRIAGPAPVLLDAHEYAPAEFEDRLAWRLLRKPYREWLCSRYLTEVAGMSTVSEGIARAYEDRYGLRPVVVHNAPERQDLAPRPPRDGLLRLVHHGCAAPGRGLERLVEAARLLGPGFTLDLVLLAETAAERRCLAGLRRRAADLPQVRFPDPVPTEAIPHLLNGYDVGVYLLPPTSLNNRLALPNKLFEFVQARLAVAIGPSPEMERLVRRHGFGLVAEGFEAGDLARALRTLTPERLGRLKAAAHRAADELCYERSAEAFVAEVDRVMRRRAAR